MDRRTFLIRSALMAAGGLVLANSPALANLAEKAENGELSFDSELYKAFKTPDGKYRPFVRWWWNGNKVEPKEIVRELHLLKNAGIGGVEINPIAFPSIAEDTGQKSLLWLSDEWIDMLKVAFDEAKQLDMTCDLLVGSGWPFGSETLPMDERAQAVFVYIQEIEGPAEFTITQKQLHDAVDPEITHKNPDRQFETIQLQLVPNPMDDVDKVIDLGDQLKNDTIRVQVPAGKHAFYGVVRINSFAEVINGAPGAAGSILDHMNAKAVRKYLDNMSGTIERRIGPLKNYIRAVFTDSMELEGSNWTHDFAPEFEKRRGYNLMPYLPFILLEVGRLGAAKDVQYQLNKTAELDEAIKRVRFDFELTKAELLYERFTQTYLQWARDIGVKSRAQAYGRGFFPLESSLGYDIPEGESWTQNYLKHKLGEEMGDGDYRRGRGYVMINKYVSSAAHLTGKRVVSAEEMTNTYLVFVATLDLIKLGSDMSAISGITHSIWHGFNYSPPDAPYPGWVQYGAYYNENNPWWPYWKLLNDYRARVSSQLQNGDMYTDIALLPANYDLWKEYGVQTDPFPERLNTPYFSLIWEAIHKTGGGADITTENIIRDSEVRNGKLCYGPKEYSTLFMVDITSTSPETLAKLYEFVSQGGRVFCVGQAPSKSLGLYNYQERDKEIQAWVQKLMKFEDRFIGLGKPSDNRYLEWYANHLVNFNLPHYLTIEQPDRYLLQNRYQRDDNSEMILFLNAHRFERRKTKVTFSDEITRGRYAWLWDSDTGKKYRIELKNGNSLDLDMGPEQTYIIIFDQEQNGPAWEPKPLYGKQTVYINEDWEVELNHYREGWTKTIHMDELTDLMETEYDSFMGTAVYRHRTDAGAPKPSWINLGTVWGIAEVYVNGVDCGVQWYGDRIVNIADAVKDGSNLIEVKVTTTMGAYLKKELSDNKTVRRFMIDGNKDQPLRSMGLLGPVTLY